MATGETTSPMDQLTTSQRATGQLIESIVRNFKKDPPSRKTVHYYEERLKRLDSAWAEFEHTDNKIRCLEKLQLDHKYFTENYYQNIEELVTKYREIFESGIQETSKTLDNCQENTNKAPPATAKTFLTCTSTNATIRRQNVMMSSLKRLLDTDPTANNMKLKEKLWDEIQELHFKIWESSDDPLKEGYDMDSYENLEKRVIENFKLVFRTPEQGFEPTQNNVLPLPKVTIQKFNGDYLKWRSFHDLFTQLVDNQHIPAVQKIGYLKSNLGGEAEKLISHLSATAENYATAWSLLQERYNNQCVIVTSLMQQLLDQPNAGPSAAAIKQLHDTTRMSSCAEQHRDRYRFMGSHAVSHTY